MTPLSLLDRILRLDAPAYALLHRPGATGPEWLEVLVGDVSEHDRIADIPLLADGRGAPGEAGNVLALLPYRQVRERGFASYDDKAPLLAITITEQAVLAVRDVLDRLPNARIDLDGAAFDMDDDEYEELVRHVVDDEIGRGTGANFVIKRTFTADVTNWSANAALSLYRRLVGRDPGSYWTFLIHTSQRTLVGASPERHVTVTGDSVAMNPISGTLRYAETGADVADVLAFLADDKEVGELHMVLDEELKMMARVCDLGCMARGPYLRPMARLAHTEYVLEGRSSRDVREILRETLPAPTVTGGPLESACRVILRHERDGRGYYGGVLALIGIDGTGATWLDSAIVIRTADIDSTGRLRIAVGATLVAKSDPRSEARETRAKAASLLEALGDPAWAATNSTCCSTTAISTDPAVLRSLRDRNTSMAPFWFENPRTRDYRVPALVGRKVLVIDAEDMFTAMARQMIAALGCDVQVRRFDADYDPDAFDVVVVGPGPGDPNDTRDPKIARIRRETAGLLERGRPFLAVCLGHQILSVLLGLPVVRKIVPSQGVQRSVSVFGRTERVGFYNTFAARCPTDRIALPARRGDVEVFRDADSGEVHGLRGSSFASVQFHPVSVLTPGGAGILGDVLAELSAAQLADRLLSAPTAVTPGEHPRGGQSGKRLDGPRPRPGIGSAIGSTRTDVRS